MLSRLFLMLYFLVSSFAASSQNLSGTWEGSSGGDYCKLVILQINDSCFGYTYDTGLGHCKANFIGSYKESSKNLKGLNTSFIEKSFFHVLSTYNLTYSVKDGIEYLRGSIGSKSAATKILSFGISSMVWYKKISSQIDTTKFIDAKIEGRAGEQLAEIKDIVFTSPVEAPVKPEVTLKSIKESRVSALIKTLETEVDSIRLVLYDNGEIDGDTVTVFYNGSIVYNSVPLTAKPLEITLAVNKSGSINTIELMANNLGSIPPNTALLLIFTGNERHELRVSSDYSTNVQINIKYIEINR